jgi:predicted metal-dependent phosphotriesterase family hydrolase
MSHRCLQRRLSRAAVIESNESKGPLRAHLHWSIPCRTAIEQLAESKAENIYIVACHFDSIQQKLRHTSW